VLAVQGIARCADVHDCLLEPGSVVLRQRHAQVENGIWRSWTRIGKPVWHAVARFVHLHGAPRERVAEGKRKQRSEEEHRGHHIVLCVLVKEKSLEDETL
jgi:hypothetical protein